MEADRPRVAENIEGERVTPSVLAIIDGSPLVGVTAKRQTFLNPKNTFYTTKKLLGITPEQASSLDLTYDFSVGDSGSVTIRAEDGAHPLEEIISSIFLRLKETAESTLGYSVKNAVIAVPSYYTNVQKSTLTDAALRSGLEVKFINEDIAAAIAFASIDQNTKNRNVFVYDFGGHSFSVSVVKIRDNSYEVAASARDLTLGGALFDKMVFDYLVEEFKKKTNIDLTTDPAAVQKLKDTAERVKMELSTSLTSDIQLPYIAADESGPKHLEEKLSRAQLERMVLPELLKTIPICKQVLEECRMEPQHITDLVLCGGQSRMPKIQELTKELFGKDASRALNFDELIAIGAVLSSTITLQAPKAAEQQTMLFNPLDLGIELFGGLMHPIVPLGLPMPAEGSTIISIANDNQKEIDIKIFQGQSKCTANNLSVGSFTFKNIETAPKGEALIKISMLINAVGTITVTVQNLVNGELLRTQFLHAIKSEEDIHQNAQGTLQAQEEEKYQAAKLSVEIHKEIHDLMRVIHHLKAVISENDFVDVKKDFEKLTTEIEKSPLEDYIKLRDDMRLKFTRILRNAMNKTIETQAL
uniref:Uncharacterized protein n=1 Tax=Arcella intermedia TaxID=1963864 RepID=A0A6B2L034_9EUKA